MPIRFALIVLATLCGTNEEIARILADADFRERFLAPQMFEPMASSPEEFAEFIKAQSGKWAKVIHEGKLRIQ